MAKRRLITAKRVVFWGPVAILAILYFFGHELGFFPGGSPRIGTESGPPADTSEDVDETTVKVMAPESNAKFRTSSGRVDENAPDDSQNGETANSQEAENSGETPSPRLLHVLIDERELFIAANSPGNDESPDWQPAGINEIVKLSQQITPNEAGLRVLISRRGSSRVSTEMELLEALRQAGVTDDEIHLEEKLIP